jgi:hypothetical protein
MNNNQVLGMLSAMNSILQEAIRIVSTDDGDNGQVEKLKTPPPPPVQKKAVKRLAVKTPTWFLPNPFERIQRDGPNKSSAARRRAVLLARERVVLDLLDQWSTASDVAAVCDAPAGMVRATLVRLVMSGTVLVREARFGQTGVSGRPARQFKVYKQGDQR